MPLQMQLQQSNLPETNTNNPESQLTLSGLFVLGNEGATFRKSSY